jgi:hypothetical protein
MFDPVSLDPLTLLRQASMPIRATAGSLAVASAAVWAIGVFKLLQQPFQGDFFRDSASRRAVDT